MTQGTPLTSPTNCLKGFRERICSRKDAITMDRQLKFKMTQRVLGREDPSKACSVSIKDGLANTHAPNICFSISMGIAFFPLWSPKQYHPFPDPSPYLSPQLKTAYELQLGAHILMACPYVHSYLNLAIFSCESVSCQLIRPDRTTKKKGAFPPPPTKRIHSAQRHSINFRPPGLLSSTVPVLCKAPPAVSTHLLSGPTDQPTNTLSYLGKRPFPLSKADFLSGCLSPLLSPRRFHSIICPTPLPPKTFEL